MLTRPAVALDEGRQSFLSIEQPNLVFCALRRSFDGRSHILRLHEAHDARTALTWQPDPAVPSATPADLVERPIPAAAAGPLSVDAFGVLTLRLDR